VLVREAAQEVDIVEQELEGVKSGMNLNDCHLSWLPSWF
jgi:hypothetical protein